MHPLPSLHNIEAFRAWRANAAQCLPAALDIARHHGLPVADPHLFTTGTNLVVGLGRDLILKIFPPMLRGQFLAERLSLRLLQARLSIPIPEIVVEGERDGWPYLVITRLHGILGTAAWPALPEDAKESVLGQIGETIAEVQKVPVGELAAIEPRWDQFIRQQIADCWARHMRLGLPPGYRRDR
jgi:hygromycin-B 7''-O-kinase